MTGGPLNSAPIDVNCLDENHSLAPQTKALTKSIIDDNVFISFKVGSIEAQVFSWKSMPSIHPVQQDVDYKRGSRCGSAAQRGCPVGGWGALRALGTPEDRLTAQVRPQQTVELFWWLIDLFLSVCIITMLLLFWNSLFCCLKCSMIYLKIGKCAGLFLHTIKTSCDSLRCHLVLAAPCSVLRSSIREKQTWLLCLSMLVLFWISIY